VAVQNIDRQIDITKQCSTGYQGDGKEVEYQNFIPSSQAQDGNQLLVTGWSHFTTAKDTRSLINIDHPEI
jgi:hypothetical protein